MITLYTSVVYWLLFMITQYTSVVYWLLFMITQYTSVVYWLLFMITQYTSVVYWFVFKKRNQNVKDGINKISDNWGTKITTNTKVIIYSAIKEYSKSPKFNTLKIREIKHITTTKQLTTNTTETTWLDWYPDATKRKKTRSPRTVCVFFLCIGRYWRTHET